MLDSDFGGRWGNKGGGVEKYTTKHHKCGEIHHTYMQKKCKEAGHARRDTVEQEMMEEGREWKVERRERKQARGDRTCFG